MGTFEELKWLFLLLGVIVGTLIVTSMDDWGPLWRERGKYRDYVESMRYIEYLGTYENVVDPHKVMYSDTLNRDDYTSGKRVKVVEKRERGRK